MYHTTGLTKEQIVDVCAMIHRDTDSAQKCWPPILGLYKSVVITLTYLRRNRVQVELGETYDVSQPTVSRAIGAITPLLVQVLHGEVPTAEDLDPRTQYLVDGTLLPCWPWREHPELYSGKHHTTGMNVQVVATLGGQLAWISDPIDGRRHDTHCLRDSGALDTLDPADWVGDKGYVGNGMITPIKKPAHRDLLGWEKEFNTAINRIRYVIERTIANFKADVQPAGRHPSSSTSPASRSREAISLSEVVARARSKRDSSVSRDQS
ncbi:transposase family protein [Intrasporangium sp.]|uniref:transposase family protein n=1 Tax=Intrasporangium sp. TaxID=1925024 RepID=UPI00322162FB